MKLPVYDQVNKSRLLGELNVPSDIKGYRYEVVVHDLLNTQSIYSAPGSGADYRGWYGRILFDLDRQSHSHATKVNSYTRTILTTETTILLTKATLEKLMKLDKFWLPGEGSVWGKPARFSDIDRAMHSSYA